MNIDVEPIWKSPYFQYIKQGKEKRGKNNIDLLSPVPLIKRDQKNQVK